MSEENIVSYSRQRIVNRIFIVFVITVIIAISIWIYLSGLEAFEVLIFSFFLIPLGVLLVSAILGAASKKGIDYIPGEWEESSKWVGFSEYREIANKYEEAYGHLYAHSDSSCNILCFLIIAPMLGFGVLAYIEIATPLFSKMIDTLLLTVIYYCLITVLGFLMGFRIPTIDSDAFFKAPASGDDFEFTEALNSVSGLKAGMNVKMGRRSGVQTLIEAEPKIFIEGLPDTVTIKVQVSHSGFAYPYLVGTIYKGPKVPDFEEGYGIRTRYPALIETSMDGEVAVFVARFDIPKRTSSVPSISDRDFRKLAKLLVERMKESYNRGA